MRDRTKLLEGQVASHEAAIDLMKKELDINERQISAYNEALKEWTRDRVPLDWATTQNNLGGALSALGQRESGTDRREQAVTRPERLPAAR